MGPALGTKPPNQSAHLPFIKVQERCPARPTPNSYEMSPPPPNPAEPGADSTEAAVLKRSLLTASSVHLLGSQILYSERISAQDAEVSPWGTAHSPVRASTVGHRQSPSKACVSSTEPKTAQTVTSLTCELPLQIIGQ